MTTQLLVLCIAAFATVAVSASVTVAILLRAFDRVAGLLAPRQQVRMWIGLAVVPIVFGMVAIAVAFLPTFGIGEDHCLSHASHHPHLCPYHDFGGPSSVICAVAVAMLIHLALIFVRTTRLLRTSDATSRSYLQGCELHDDICVLPTTQPQAFVLGCINPRIHISKGLLALGEDVVEPVLAHERIHLDRHDLLWRLLCSSLSLGHLPWVSDQLMRRLIASQETAADAEAAGDSTGGRLRIAEAILAVAKAKDAPSHAIAFADGDMITRIRTLLHPHVAPSKWATSCVAVIGLLLALALAQSHAFVHHALETLLGFLS